MRKINLICTLALAFCTASLCGCDTGSEETESSQAVSQSYDKTASSDETVQPENIVEDGMIPVYAESIKDGVYNITAESSSSMFNITSCSLTVSDGKMSAEMTMGGKGYLYVFMGKGTEAVKAEESEYIPFAENEKGEHTFTVPVEALDYGIDCAAFSKKKEKWYDRTILFRADSLPKDALDGNESADSAGTELEDGIYKVNVTLSGGSGKAKVESPARITVSDGKITAEIKWGSSKYDYMIVDGEKYMPTNTDGNSVFEIPVSAFDFNMPVKADTTAMSTPHEIDYTLNFDSASIEKE